MNRLENLKNRRSLGFGTGKMVDPDRVARERINDQNRCVRTRL